MVCSTGAVRKLVCARVSDGTLRWRVTAVRNDQPCPGPLHRKSREKRSARRRAASVYCLAASPVYRAETHQTSSPLRTYQLAVTVHYFDEERMGEKMDGHFSAPLGERTKAASLSVRECTHGYKVYMCVYVCLSSLSPDLLLILPDIIPSP